MLEPRFKKMPDGTREITSYRVRVRIKGTLTTIATIDGSVDPSTAQTLHDELMAERKTGVTSDKVLVTARAPFDELLDFHREGHVKKKCTAGTQATYEVIAKNHIRPYLGHLPTGAIDAELLEDWRDTLLDDGVGAPTVIKAMTIVEGTYTFAERKGRARYNPGRAAEKPSGERKRHIRPIDPTGIERIAVDLESQGLYADAMIVRTCGFQVTRPGEALGLEVESIVGDVLAIDSNAVDGELRSTKTGNNRVVRLFPSVAKDLRAYLVRTGLRAGPLFPSENGGFWSDDEYRSWRRYVFVPAAKRCGIENFVPNHLRHSGASLLIHCGWKVQEVATFMGNRAKTCSDNYSHIFESCRNVKERDPELAILAAKDAVLKNEYPKSIPEPLEAIA